MKMNKRVQVLGLVPSVSSSLSMLVLPAQVLQAMGYPTGFDSDLDPMSSDEKSDGEGKSETSSHTSNNPTHSTDSSNTLEVSTKLCFEAWKSTEMNISGLKNEETMQKLCDMSPITPLKVT